MVLNVTFYEKFKDIHDEYLQNTLSLPSECNT